MPLWGFSYTVELCLSWGGFLHCRAVSFVGVFLHCRAVSFVGVFLHCRAVSFVGFFLHCRACGGFLSQNSDVVK